MKILSRFNVSREKDGPRKFAFELSMSGVISVGIVVVLGMCWIFILGILVGRGYKPEAAVPQIAQMMPTTQVQPPDNTTPSEPPKVLRPEELQFMEQAQAQAQAQGKDGEVVAESTQKAPADGKKTTAPVGHNLPDARPTTLAGGAAAATQPKPRPTAAVAAEPRSRAPKVEPKDPFEKKTGSRFTATYQVASFPSKDQADAMVKRLAKNGYAASIHEAKSNKKTVFRVNVRLKGTETEITGALKKTGEKGPILLGKKPL